MSQSIQMMGKKLFQHIEDPEALVDDLSVLNFLIIIDMMAVYILIFFFFLWRHRRQREMEQMQMLHAPERHDRQVIKFMKELVRLIVHLFMTGLLYFATAYFIFRMSELLTRKQWNLMYQQKVDERLIIPLEKMGFSYESIMKFLRISKLDTFNNLKLSIVEYASTMIRQGGSINIQDLLSFLTNRIMRGGRSIQQLLSENQSNVVRMVGKSWYSGIWKSVSYLAPKDLYNPLEMINLLVNPMAGMDQIQMSVRKKDILHEFEIFFTFYIPQIISFYGKLLKQSLITSGTTTLMIQGRTIYQTMKQIKSLLKHTEYPALPPNMN